MKREKAPTISENASARWETLSACTLRNKQVIQDMHREALRSSSQEIIDLLVAQPEDICQRTLMSDITPDDDMGEYHHKMD
jgi:hypothetical protein